MSTNVLYYFTVSVAMLTCNVITSAKGQSTVAQGCETGDQSDSVVESIDDLKEEVRNMRQLLIESFQQIKTQLQTVDQRLTDHDISIKNQTQTSWKLASELAFGVHDWKVIMNRFNGSLNFNRSWTEYRNGFGDKERGEFWLGNEEVHRLTNRFLHTLRIEVQLKTSGRWYYAEYSSFSLDSESNKYTLRISGYSGNAGDSITSTSFRSTGYLDRMKFSTWDSDSDEGSSQNCALDRHGGWWFNWCQLSCLTCQYTSHDNFRWYSLNHLETEGLLRGARMLIKCK